MFTTRFEAWVRRHAEALMSAIQRLPVTPNQITVVGTALTFAAAVLTAFGQLRWGGVVLAFAGTFDILDGALARSTGRSYAYGAFLDSTLDRYSEGAMYLGLIAYFVSAGGPFQRWLILATAAALGGSFLVSYVRARAQSLGFTCESGLFARPERGGRAHGRRDPAGDLDQPDRAAAHPRGVAAGPRAAARARARNESSPHRQRAREAVKGAREGSRPPLRKPSAPRQRWVAPGWGHK